MLGQDILKALGGRDPPIANFFVFDGNTGGGTVCRLNMPWLHSSFVPIVSIYYSRIRSSVFDSPSLGSAPIKKKKFFHVRDSAIEPTLDFTTFTFELYRLSFRLFLQSYLSFSEQVRHKKISWVFILFHRPSHVSISRFVGLEPLFWLCRVIQTGLTWSLMAIPLQHLSLICQKPKTF